MISKKEKLLYIIKIITSDPMMKNKLQHGMDLILYYNIQNYIHR